MSIAEKLKIIAENEQKVYEAGKNENRAYHEFWDTYQNKGDRTDYSCAFGGPGWLEDTLKPKYDVIPKSAPFMFYRSSFKGSIKEHFENCGKKLDFSQCTGFVGLFQFAPDITELPIIDVSKATSKISQIFYQMSSLVTIEELIIGENTVFDQNSFTLCNNLTNVVFSGTLASNDVKLIWSTKLTHDSLMSLINILKDFSGTDTTRTLNLGATNLAKLTDAEKAIATQRGWTLI